MNAFGLLFYALLFFLPASSNSLSDFIWRHAPEWMPELAPNVSGATVNGGYYVVMGGLWALLSLTGWALGQALTWDDAAWHTVFRPFESRGWTILLDIGLLVLTGLVFLGLFWNRLPTHEILALSLPLISTLVDGLRRLAIRKPSSRKTPAEGSVAGDAPETKEEKAPSLKLPRALKKEEPRPVTLESLDGATAPKG